MINRKIIKNNIGIIINSLKNRCNNLNIEDLIKLENNCSNSDIYLEKLMNKKNHLVKKLTDILNNNEEDLELKDEIKKINIDIKNRKKIISNDLEIFNQLLLRIPNIPDKSVPIGMNENDNVEVKKVNEIYKFNFDVKSHWDIGKSLNIIDIESAANISGSRFSIYKNKGAELLRALQMLTLDILKEEGFEEYLLPVIINSKSLINTAQLPILIDDVFKLNFKDFYLSPTLEVQLTNLFSNKILDINNFPYKVTSSSLNFRLEAGSAGKDVKGLIRQHQFYKTEMVIISIPDDSYKMLEYMLRTAEKILQCLELPYRVITLCTGDMGFSSAKTYDIEVFLPFSNKYREISSCSNCTDFQARRAKIRYKNKDGKNEFVHTLNGSGLAIDRLWVAVVENYQQSDGTIKIPRILEKYLNFREIKYDK
ncbi:MAG: serine--tRNA ligase [Mycoplasmoidaceae bacterium]